MAGCIAAVSLMALLNGCMHWTAVPEPRALAYAEARVFRVTLTTGAVIEVHEPFIVGDSLQWHNPKDGQRTGVPLAEISLFEAWALDKAPTTILVVLVSIPLTIALVAACGDLEWMCW